MIVVSDNGPVAFLVQIGSEGLLPQLYGEVLIPPAVDRELRDLGTPEPIRRWLTSAPAWLRVELPLAPTVSSGPGLGEREAIQLAKERGALLLCDDRPAVSQARSAGLLVTGTLGVLRDAHGQNLVDVEAALSLLKSRTDFRFPPAPFVAMVVTQAKELREQATNLGTGRP